LSGFQVFSTQRDARRRGILVVKVGREKAPFPFFFLLRGVFFFFGGGGGGGFFFSFFLGGVGGGGFWFFFGCFWGGGGGFAPRSSKGVDPFSLFGRFFSPSDDLFCL